MSTDTSQTDINEAVAVAVANFIEQIDDLRAEVERKEALRQELAAEVDRLRAVLAAHDPMPGFPCDNPACPCEKPTDIPQGDAWPAAAPLPRRVPGEALKPCGWMGIEPMTDPALEGRTEGSGS